MQTKNALGRGSYVLHAIWLEIICLTVLVSWTAALSTVF
jgi:hypothetical protein